MRRKWLVFAMSGLFSMSFQIHARENTENDLSESWKCRLQFTAQSEGRQVLAFGDYTLAGSGEFVCQQFNIFATEPQSREVVFVKSSEELKKVSDNLNDIHAPQIEVHIPVKITIAGKSLLDVGLGRMRLSGYSYQWSLTKRLEHVLGKFIAFKAYGSLGLGAGGFTAIKTDSNGISMELGLQATSGIGFHYGISHMDVSLRDGFAP